LNHDATITSTEVAGLSRRDGGVYRDLIADWYGKPGR
jgi:hypothetical protein